jgi:predicted nucleotidyltransferase
MTVEIDRLFGSKTRVALLSRPMGIRYSMLYKEVKNLRSLGIINEDKRGKVTFVSVNRKLPYLAELKGLMAKTAGLVAMLRDSFSEIERIRFALIYGSFASGDQTESSDVDLLIIGDVEEERVLKSISQVEKKVGRDINYVLWNSNVP